ncbi:MAG TPA: hypothetical protein DCS91_08340 [Microcoleaceae bacterium UBA11344]|nr:hypothetical protein [Microcoleaceae cyanobacterium UBA11344]
MLAGGLNQRIRENSYFFTIIYFTGRREQGEGEGPGKFGRAKGLTINCRGRGTMGAQQPGFFTRILHCEQQIR